MALEEYRRKRDFSTTPEPSGDAPPRRPRRRASGDAVTWESLPHGRRFCVQMHRATRLHFDFRLEHDGVLLSWAIPRGPTLDPAFKRLAVMTEDHPIDYGDFEGVIPSGYGAGTVLLWDIGTFEWVKESAEDFERSRARGDVKFSLQGTKISGEFALVHIGERGRRYGGSSDETKNWLMIKKRDASVVEKYEAVEHAVSVKTGRTMEQIAAEAGGDPREMARAAKRASAPRAREPASPPARAKTKSQPAAGEGSLRAPQPMMARSVDRPFSREGWLFELKYDGVRAIFCIDSGKVTVTGRRGRDETARYPEAQLLATAIGARRAIVDGEIVVLDEQGVPSFERLQSRINVTRQRDIEAAALREPAAIALFDILRLEDRDLCDTDLRIRKKTLRDVLRDQPGILFADHLERDGEAFFAAVQERGVEGMVAKRAASTYQPGRRSDDWLKVKAWQTQSCVIAGYTAGQGRRSEHLGALILGVHRGGRLVHCGQVGTGFDERTLRRLRESFDALRSDSCALATTPKTAEPATWIRPELVCEVRHAGWTSAGILRHPAYLGLRPDVAPQDCVREDPQPLDTVLSHTPDAPQAATQHDDIEQAIKELYASARPNIHWEIAGRRLALTNLDRVLWPEDGFTKRDLIAHYVRMAPHLLPHLRDRPLSTQIFPEGIHGKSFWRKDKPSHAPEWIESWVYRGEEKTKEYIVATETATLAWLANAACIDLHPWHSRRDAPDQPDWAVFDLDPFEPATFDDVRDVAHLVKAALDHYRMHSVLKTSGQTGLQIYVPLRRGPDYTAVRGWVEEVGRAIGKVMPDRITWEWSVAKRDGRIRIDYTQNIINKTLTAPYTVRPALRAPVSTPITWDELDDPKLRPDRWTIRDIGERLAQVSDLFAGALGGDQELPRG